MLVKFDEISDDSRLWIYQIDKELSQTENDELLHETISFLASWTAHGSNLKAAAKIEKHRLLLIAVDESSAGASGCSIDSKMAFLREIQLKMKIDLFSRSDIFYVEKSSFKSMDLNNFKNLISKGELSEETLIYNTTIHRKGQLKSDFLIPVKNSWLMKMISVA